jgi:hypothetical protein
MRARPGSFERKGRPGGARPLTHGGGSIKTVDDTTFVGSAERAGRDRDAASETIRPQGGTSKRDLKAFWRFHDADSVAAKPVRH